MEYLVICTGQRHSAYTLFIQSMQLYTFMFFKFKIVNGIQQNISKSCTYFHAFKKLECATKKYSITYFFPIFCFIMFNVLKTTILTALLPHNLLSNHPSANLGLLVLAFSSSFSLQVALQSLLYISSASPLYGRPVHNNTSVHCTQGTQ